MLTAHEQRLLYDRLVEKANKDVAAAFLAAIVDSRNNVPFRELAEAIEAGDLRRVEALLRFSQGSLFPLTEAMRSAYIAGATSVLQIARGEFGFGGLHTRAVEYVATQGGSLVTQIDEQQREGLQDILRHRIETGESGTATARKITGALNRATGRREGGFIGLSAPQTQWAINAENELRNLDANYFTRQNRNKRFDSMVRRAIKDGKPLSQADIDRAVNAYKDRLLKQRGEIIARNEAHTGTALGQWQQMEALAAQGVMVTKRWVRSFSREPRLDHAALASAPSRPLNIPFVTAAGVQMRFPHDNEAPASETLGCKCSTYFRVIVPSE